MLVRHSCFSRSKIAEMSVPAWPMPTHQTKLTMAKPHITGTSTPQMPTPLANRYVTATRSIIVIAKATANPKSQPR